eukprot:scaffold9956_cov62-Phaeocystis_antarctica.AAC.3
MPHAPSCIVHHYQSHPSAACAHLTRPNISHASRAAQSRCHLISLPSHLISLPSRGRPSQAAVATNNPLPLRYPSSSSAPRPTVAHAPLMRGPAPSDDLYGRPWLWQRVSLSVCLLSVSLSALASLANRAAIALRPKIALRHALRGAAAAAPAAEAAAEAGRSA